MSNTTKTQAITSKALKHAASVLIDHIQAEIQYIEDAGVPGTDKYFNELVEAYDYLTKCIEKAAGI